MNVDELVRRAGERLAEHPVTVPSFERVQRAARRRHQASVGVATVAALALATAGFGAISGGDAGTIRSSASTTVPTTLPPSSSIATTVGPAAAEVSAPTTPPAEGAPDDLVAILDPVLDLGPAYTQGEASQYLAGLEPATHVAIRRAVDGSVIGAVSWTFRAGVDSDGQNPAWTYVTLADGRIATRYENPPRVSYVLQLDRGYVTASITSAREPDLVAWLEALPADAATDTLTPPVGYELLPDVEATSGVMYFRDEIDAAGEINAAWQASVMANRLDAEMTLADWVAARFEGDVEPIGANGALLVANGDAGTVVWQPDPQVIVEMYGPAANLARFVDALRLVPRDEANLVPTALTTGPYPVAEQDVTRSVLGETSTGRFAYIQYRLGDGECFWIDHRAVGGYGSCEPPLVRPLCMTSTTGKSWTAVAIVIDRTSADIALDVDGLPVDGTTEQGVALDGTPWVSWSATDIPNGPDPSVFPGTITIDGTACLPWLS